MTPVELQELFVEAKCFACYGFSEDELLTIALTNRWAQAFDPAADISPEAILSGSASLLSFGLNLYQAVAAGANAIATGQSGTTTQELNSLLDRSKCFSCLGASTAQLVAIAQYIGALVALDASADVTLDGLLDYGKCYAAIGLSSPEVVIISLLDQIYQASP